MYTIRFPFILRIPFKHVFWRLPQKEKTVYLTFDDGPIPEVTPWVLALLEKENIKATFFCVGENVEKHPKVYASLLAQGHSTGQHTYNHLPAFKHSRQKYLSNVEKAQRYISSDLFRPPHGQIRLSQLWSFKTHHRVVMWDVLSGDFDQHISPKKCYQNVIKYVRNGSIIVFHDSIKAEANLRYALPKVIAFLKQKGYRFEAIV